MFPSFCFDSACNELTCAHKALLFKLNHIHKAYNFAYIALLEAIFGYVCLFNDMGFSMKNMTKKATVSQRHKLSVKGCKKNVAVAKKFLFLAQKFSFYRRWRNRSENKTCSNIADHVKGLDAAAGDPVRRLLQDSQ